MPVFPAFWMPFLNSRRPVWREGRASFGTKTIIQQAGGYSNCCRSTLQLLILIVDAVGIEPTTCRLRVAEQPISAIDSD